MLFGCQKNLHQRSVSTHSKQSYSDESPYKDGQLLLPKNGLIQRIDQKKIVLSKRIITRCIGGEPSIYQSENQFYWVIGSVVKWDKRYDNSLILATLSRDLDQLIIKKIPLLFKRLGVKNEVNGAIIRGEDLYFMGQKKIYMCRIISLKEMFLKLKQNIGREQILKSPFFIRQEIKLKSSSIETQ